MSGLPAVVVRPGATGDDVRRVLDALPAWFGIPAANEAYVAGASRLRGWTAYDGDQPVGVALVDQRYSGSAELHLLGVLPERHRRGIGRLMVTAISASLASEGVRLLQVDTVGPSYADEGYARTRAFYEALGFLPLVELARVDWDGPTLILVRPLP